MKRVLGIGNALVDLLINLEDDAFLADFGLEKGSMTLIDRDKMNALLNRSVVLNLTMSKSSGGSVANTIHGLAQLGSPAGYIGKIGDDDYGDFFRSYMEHLNIQSTLFKGRSDTGKSIILVSPDSERTMATYLGAAIELNAEDLTPEPFLGYDYFHLEGYLVQDYELVKKASMLAKEAECQISIDLASFNIVRENLDFLHRVVDEYVNIVIANEDEAKTFTALDDPEAALEAISKTCDIAVVKIGKDGSLIKKGTKKYKINPIDSRCIDTTGAGDLYASGFFYGLISGQPVDICGKIGSIISGKVIEVIGAKMDAHRWNEGKRLIGAIV
ncbi:MAG: adenosine kinase [Candidatus Omnitrophota bacterium]